MPTRSQRNRAVPSSISDSAMARYTVSLGIPGPMTALVLRILGLQTSARAIERDVVTDTPKR